MSLAQAYNPRKGGINHKLFATHADLEEDGSVKPVAMQRIEASLKGLINVTEFGSFTASCKQLAKAYYFASKSQVVPEVLIPVCQLCAPGSNDEPRYRLHGHLCECNWFDVDMQLIKRCDVSSMAFGLAEKLDANVRQEMVGRDVRRGARRGVVVAHCSQAAFTAGEQQLPLTPEESAANADLWEVCWGPATGGHREHVNWAALVSMLVNTKLGDGDEEPALHAAELVGHCPAWASAESFAGLPAWR
eukprot:COSAG01_NODE_10645_length_2113_cov_2.349057_2_plen_247_part_00